MVENDKLLDISEVLSGEKKETAFKRLFNIGGNDVSVTVPCEISGTVINMASYIELRCIISVSYKAVCSRCLKDIDSNMTLNLVFPIAVSLENSDTDDYIIPENGKIDLHEICEVNFFLNLPIRELCSESCKGLCPKCGVDLNISDCSCPKKDVDPRLEGLADFFN